MANKYLDDSGLSYFWTKLKAYFQEKLISGTNIKTINSQSLLGSGDIVIQGSGVDNVIAQGTDNGWTYRKWGSGVYEAWQTKDLNLARSTSYGTLYRCVEQTMLMPSFNVGTDYIVAGSVGGGDWLDTNNIYATSFTYYMVRTSSASAQARTARFYIHGTYS